MVTILSESGFSVLVDFGDTWINAFVLSFIRFMLSPLLPITKLAVLLGTTIFACIHKQYTTFAYRCESKETDS